MDPLVVAVVPPVVLSLRISLRDLLPRVNRNLVGELPGLGWGSTRRLRSSPNLLNVSNSLILSLIPEFRGFHLVFGLHLELFGLS